jgi:hypothetical protein
MSRAHWPAKDPAEVLVATFDYASEINSGETIASAVVTCSVLAGTDPTPAAVLAGSASIAGGTVLQPFQGGVDGVSYTLRCAATLSPSGRVLVLAATLPVRGA